MAKRIIVVNAGPRKGWNTDTLIKEALLPSGKQEQKGCRHPQKDALWAAEGKRPKALPSVGHAPSGLGVYVLSPLDVVTELWGI